MKLSQTALSKRLATCLSFALHSADSVVMKKKNSGGPGHPGREWLVLGDNGLKSVRKLLEDISGNKGERDGNQLIDALKKMGMFSYIRTVFVWQDLEICKQFVLNWSRKRKTTRVNDVEIDVNFGTFMEATGLQCEEHTVISEDADRRAEAPDNSSVLMSMMAKRLENKSSVRLDDFKGSWLQDLLLLFRNTIWMQSSLREEYLSPPLLQYVSKALNGKRLSLGKLIHDKFACEIARLQHASSLGEQPKNVLMTSAGPVICFLYAHAVLTRSLASLDVLPSVAGEKTMKVSIEFRQEQTRKIIYNGERRVPKKSEDESCVKEGRVSGMPAKLSSREVTSSCQLHHPAKKRRLQESVPASSLPRDSSTIEGWAAKVLELKVKIARQSYELAQCRLRLFKERPAA
ncbi:hypothetical protein R1sor_024831 [Riccia sorocarpa]|uniref:Uncharacterized protein n=1 Tax=Riccia sorocarpa TaxID=122646 RepID=A0ABD3GUR4_9MARC